MSLARSVKSSAADDAPALNAAFLGAIELASTFGATGLSLHAARNSAVAAMVRGCFITRVRVKGWRPSGDTFLPSAAGLSQRDPVLCGPASRPGCLCRDGVSKTALTEAGWCNRVAKGHDRVRPIATSAYDHDGKHKRSELWRGRDGGPSRGRHGARQRPPSQGRRARTGWHTAR